MLLYGAYGYTGRLTAKLAAARGLDVVLAGRNENALAELGARVHLPTRVVGLDDLGKLSRALSDIACVVHMAGPFALTSAAPMLSACLATRTNYIDITGEIEVFEALWSRARGHQARGITVVPGAGFDVVPTDCLAAYVANKSERLESLVMALRGLEGASQGTLRTAVRQLSKPVLCRRSGNIVPLNDRSPGGSILATASNRVCPFHGAMSLLHFTRRVRRTSRSTSAERPCSARRMLSGSIFGPVMRSRIGQNGLAAIVRRFPEGPSRAERVRHRATIWAETIDSSGKSFRAMLSTPDPYDFTASCALEISSESARFRRHSASRNSGAGVRRRFRSESAGMRSHDLPPA